MASKTIAVIPPIRVADFERERRRVQYEKFAGSEINIDVRLLKGGPELTDREYELFWSTGFMIIEAELAATEGAAAIVIDCTGDPGIEQIAECVDIPVIGALSAGVHLALQVGRKFSVLALDHHWDRMVETKLRDYGLMNQVASLEAVGTHVYQPQRGRNMDQSESDQFFQKLVEAGQRAVAAGADSVVLGSTTIIDGRKDLESAIGVPVIAPGIAALKTAEMMINMDLGLSRHAYPKPAIPFGEQMRKLLGI
jgi:allantoin racemase